MTPMKGLLLASAAAVFVASGAQAADMPLKAVPVQYVKICDIYGAGFYYIPGTDTCIRVGGYIRADYYWQAGAGGFPNITGAPGRSTRADTSDYGTRARANVLMDTRTQTQYGTLRTLSSLFFQNQQQTEGFNVSRALVQWAGFTFGRSQSFTDIFYLDPYAYVTPFIGTSTDVVGVNVAAYTLEFGNGFQLTGAVEERRERASGRPVTNLSSGAALVVGAPAVDSANGERFPDFQAILRYDQAWGTIGVFGLGHDASATYYGGACVGGGQPGTTQCGHPADRIGWAAGVGGTLNLPMFGLGDRIGAQFVYSVGAAGYAANTLASAGLFGSGNNVAVGWLTDGVYVNGSAVELTTAWSVVAAYDHYWSPLFRTSLYGAYLKIDYSAAATAMFSAGCGTAGGGGTAQAAFNGLTNCNPDFSVLTVGSRWEWIPVPGFTLGTDVYWTGVQTGFAGTGTLSGGIGARPTGVYTIKDLGIISAVVRAQRVF